MTIYEMNKEQIIDTVMSVSKKYNVNVIGLWSNENHPYRWTMILTQDKTSEEFDLLLDDIFNGLKDVNGNQLMTAVERYSGDYDSCDITITNNTDYFNKILKTYKG